MMVGVSVLSGSAGVQVGGFSFVGIDKLAHFLVFGLLGIAWARSLHPEACPRPGRLFYAVFLTTLFGLLDEMHQLQNPLRTFEWADLLADFLGSLVVTLCYLRIRKFQVLLELELRDLARLRSLNWNTNSTQ